MKSIMPVVKNLKDVSQISNKPSGHASWLDYWKAQTGEDVQGCTVQGCYGQDVQGVPVVKVEDVFEDPYIAPICGACRQREDEFYVSVALAPVH